MNGSKSHGGIRRSSETELSSSGSSKRRKFELDNQCRSEINVNSSWPECRSNCDDVVSPPPCLKNDFSLDMKVKFKTVTSICSSDDGFSSRETSASSEICLDSKEMESTSGLKKKAAHMASAAEMDEFFAQAEKKEEKRFADKYNYDIVKDVPMEGRYQWVRLKQ